MSKKKKGQTMTNEQPFLTDEEIEHETKLTAQLGKELEEAHEFVGHLLDLLKLARRGWPGAPDKWVSEVDSALRNQALAAANEAPAEVLPGEKTQKSPAWGGW